MPDQFGDAGDGGRKNGLAVRHRLHQDQRDALAATGEHDQVAQPVAGVEFPAAKMAQKLHLGFEPEVSNQVFEPGTLWSFTRDQAEKIGAAALQFVAGVQQEGMIFHRVQPAHCQYGQAGQFPVRSRSRSDGARQAHSQASHDDFRRLDVGITLQNKGAVEL